MVGEGAGGGEGGGERPTCSPRMKAIANSDVNSGLSPDVSCPRPQRGSRNKLMSGAKSTSPAPVAFGAALCSPRASRDVVAPTARQCAREKVLRRCAVSPGRGRGPRGRRACGAGRRRGSVCVLGAGEQAPHAARASACGKEVGHAQGSSLLRSGAQGLAT